MSQQPKQRRCAIYTRKSTEHNLDLEFNSLHAQRESCEAYIKSQLHDGWQLVPQSYDDGGISGGSLDRPDLQRLLADIAAGKVDIVVVYKVDRLTRSLTDFAKLVELFDRHGVSFVSVTQAFNTTNSMGRLTLNVLLSFAQFEREVIAERVRDKIAASKRKGIWMGGQVPLGYINIDKKLIVVPEEALTVRWIFSRYLQLGAIMPLLKELRDGGFKTKCRLLSSKRTIGGGDFGKGGLNHLLKNRCYIGEIHHHGQFHTGCHEAIIDRELFQAVQGRLAANNVEKRLQTRNTPYLLTGYIYDSAGNRMTPSHSVKKGVRYRYYISQAILQGHDNTGGAVLRVSASDIEAQIERFFRQRYSANSEGLRPLVEANIARITIRSDHIEVRLACSAEGDNLMDETPIRLPWSRKPFHAPKGIAFEPSSVLEDTNKSTDALLRAIGKARRWVARLTAGESLKAIADEEGRGERQIRLLIPLAFVSPGTLDEIVHGQRRPPGTTALAKNVPLAWPSAVKGR